MTTEPARPYILVIFGITGDLSRRYLLPALYHLFKNGFMAEQSRIVGVTRGDTTVDELFEQLSLSDETAPDQAVIKTMHSRTTMFKMDLDDPAAYQALLTKLGGLEEELGICLNRLYYLSIPPQAYRPVVRLMGEAGLNRSCQHQQAETRLLVEKPFGFDLDSAGELISETNQYFDEQQIYRIDHYMAKETVQNILTFRFKNPIFEALWSREHIDNIEISAKESIGIEGRATFYEPLGALRDFVQNHLLQILGIILMDKPAEWSSQQIHAAKQAALEQLAPLPADILGERIIRGQYEGYRREVDNPDSATETYVSATVFSDSPRWQGVPLKLITGKALEERKTEVVITFKAAEDASRNRLRFRIQPNEGIELDLATKKPGLDYEVQASAMDFSYKDVFGEDGGAHLSAYERVLLDAARGDHTLFATSGEVLASWRVLQPALDAWARSAADLIFYTPGSAGPEQIRAANLLN